MTDDIPRHLCSASHSYACRNRARAEKQVVVTGGPFEEMRGVRMERRDARARGKPREGRESPSVS